MTGAADFDATAYQYLSDPDDFDAGAVARLGAMLALEYDRPEWERMRDAVIFPRCMRILESVEHCSSHEARRRAAAIAIRSTLHAHDILDVQQEIDELHARILARSDGNADSFDDLVARELAA